MIVCSAKCDYHWQCIPVHDIPASDMQCVFEVDPARGLALTEITEGLSVEDVRAATGCSFEVRPATLVSDITSCSLSLSLLSGISQSEAHGTSLVSCLC